MKLITLIIPCYNEEKSLPQMFARLETLRKNNAKYRFEFLFVNDGSRDGTAEILARESEKNPRISVLNFSRNFGKEIAVAAGIDHADGDAVVILDADGQEPPEIIPAMIREWENGFDDVYARRKTKIERGVKGATSRLYYRTAQKMTNIPIQIDTGDFRLFSRKCVLALREFREASRQNKALFSWIGYKKKEILFEQKARVEGRSKFRFGVLSSSPSSLINLAIDGFTSFTTVPLRLISVAGIFVSLVAFCAIVIVIVQALLGEKRAPGLPTILISVLFLGGLQMIALGIIGEYIGRIFIETKRRPLYLVQDFHRAKVAKKEAKNDEK